MFQFRGDVRSAVASCPEAAAAAASQGTLGYSRPGSAEAREKVQSGVRKIQFFLKGRRDQGTEVVRGMEGSLRKKYCVWKWKMYTYSMGRMVSGRDSLAKAGIWDNDTANICWRLRGGSLEDMPGQWTCGHCHALRCCPARKRCCLCGELRMDAPVVVPPRVTGPLGKNQSPPQRSGPPAFSVKQQQQQQQNRWAS